MTKGLFHSKRINTCRIRFGFREILSHTFFIQTIVILVFSNNVYGAEQENIQILSKEMLATLDSLTAYAPLSKRAKPKNIKKFDFSDINVVWNGYSKLDEFDHRWKGQKEGLLSSGPIPIGKGARARFFQYFV